MPLSTRAAVRNASTYAVIGPETAEELGLPSNPVGEVIRVQNTPFVIVRLRDIIFRLR